MNVFGESLRSEWREMEELRIGMRTMDPPLGYYASARTELVRHIEQMAWELRVHVLSERLDEIRVADSRTEDHECIRFATWFDHWKATYRGRWWMRWRRWTVRYNIEHHPITVRVAADLTRYWTYPEASITPPEFGEPVRYATVRQIPTEPTDEPIYWTVQDETRGEK